MSRHLVVLSTVARPQDALRIARVLVERRLAACVSVVPGLVSLYRWNGAVQQDRERLLVIKTRRAGYAALQRALQSLHPYEVPEILALPVAAGGPAYLAWLDESVRVSRRTAARARGRRSGRTRPRSRR